MKNFLLILALIFSTSAYACYTDYDCSIGSKCLKNVGAKYGFCFGGYYHGTPYDKKPVYVPIEIKYRTTCLYDADCYPGSRCIKSGGYFGLCM